MASPSVPIPTPDPTSAAWSVYVDNQDLNFTNLYGNITTWPLPIINHELYLLITQEAVFGVQIGATGVALLVSFMFSDSRKLRSPLFIANTLNLLVSLISSIATVSTYDSVSFYGLGEWLLSAKIQYSAATQYSTISVTSVINIISSLLVFISLVLHVHAVFSPQPGSQKVVTIILSVIAFVGQVCTTIWNVLFQIAAWNDQAVGNTPAYNGLYKASHAINMAILGVTCAVLIAKLYVAIRWRHKAGIRKFGVLHVLFITFSQCLVIPFIIGVLNLTLDIVNLGVIGQLILICSLPLSSLWASRELHAQRPHSQPTKSRSAFVAPVTMSKDKDLASDLSSDQDLEVGGNQP